MMTYNRIFTLVLALVLMVPPAFAGSSECGVNTGPGENALENDTGICAFLFYTAGGDERPQRIRALPEAQHCL